MNNPTPHKNLDAWKQSMDLVMDIYNCSRNFPKEEQYGLIPQMRRAAISVPSNIAEGSVGRSGIHFANYLTIAIGSLSELDTQIEISTRLGYLGQGEFARLQKQISTCKALIYGLKQSIQKKVK